MNKCLFTGLLVTVALSSCSVTQRTVTSKTVDVDTEIYSISVADLDVDKEKAEATIDWKWSLFSTFSLNTEKSNAAATLLQQTNGDVLIEPQYIVNRRGLFRGGSVTVIGYPARYTNFRSLNDAETIALKELKDEGCAVVSHAVKAEGPAVINPFAPKRVPNPIKPASFLNVIGGVSMNMDDMETDPGWDISLMYGHHGSKWGWYVKATIGSMRTDYYNYYYGSDEKKTSFEFTGGVMKPFSNTFSLFIGAGVGLYEYNEPDHKDFMIPVELGGQLSFGKFNALVGATFSVNTYEACYSKLTPFIGVGYNF